jgi:hypothetical protein
MVALDIIMPSRRHGRQPPPPPAATPTLPCPALAAGSPVGRKDGDGGAFSPFSPVGGIRKSGKDSRTREKEQ